MKEARKRSLWRGVLFSAIVLIHVGLTFVFSFSAQRSSQRPVPSDFLSLTAALYSAPARPPTLSVRDPERRTIKIDPIAPVEPDMGAAIQPNSLDQSPTPIDWGREAQQAINNAMSRNKTRDFGSAPTQPGAGLSLPTVPNHAPGEQQRTQPGQWIVWINSRCYRVVESEPLGPLDRTSAKRVICADDSKPSGELFKDLPAYQKFHSH